MKQAAALAGFGLCCLVLLGCGGAEKAKRESKMSQDIGQLSQKIKLPAQPESAQWEEQSMPGGNDSTLKAVLKFRPEVLKDLLANAQPSDRDAPRVKKAAVLDWYPQELQRMFTKEDEDILRLDGKLYDPAPFVKSPYLNGYFVRVGNTDQVFLYLMTT